MSSAATPDAQAPPVTSAVRATPATLPPGPRMPAALQLAIWSRNAQWMLRQCAARYGDTFRLQLPREPGWVVVSDPADVRQVFTGDPRVFHAGEGNRVLLPVLGEHSLLLLDEASHLRERKLLLPPFHGARMQGYEALMTEIAAEEIARWPRGERYRLRPRMQALTLEIILRAVFGLGEGERLERVRRELRRLLDFLTRPLVMLAFIGVMGPDRLAAWAPFRRFIGAVDTLLLEEIADRRRAGDLERRSDILSLLLQARQEPADGEGTPAALDDQAVRDELMTLLVAGHETTANALAWAVERLARNPATLARLTEEVGDGRTEYLDAVVHETLRLRPVISIVARRLTGPVTVGGYEVPAGQIVVPAIYLVHRRPDVYPEPDRFRPERFLERPPGTYTWIPFGGGVRRCIGAAFAQFEMRVVLAELVRHHSVRPARPADEPNFRRAITETPRYDAEVVLSPVV